MFINKGETCLLQFIMCQKSFIPFHHYVKEAINKAGECLRIKFSSAKLMHLSSALENGSNYGKSTFVVVVGEQNEFNDKKVETISIQNCSFL